MNIAIGDKGGLSRKAALLVGWLLFGVALGFGIAEWLHPGAIAGSSRTESLFSWARGEFGEKGIAIVHFFFACVALLFVAAIHLSKGSAYEG